MDRPRALTVDELHHLPARIDAFIDESWPSIVEDMRSLIAIPSVASNRLAQPGAPFGPQAREALDEAAVICRRLGLRVQEHDGRFATATVPGSEGAVKRVAVMSHIDVVPAGDGWSADPFTLTEREGYLIGRGVLDDKGPAVLSFYAALFFLQNDVQLPYELQLVIGANEEDGMEDVEAYLAACGEPDFLFTPDAEFPVCCGEKGRLVGTFSSERFLGDDIRIAEFEGGQATNAIPGSAFAVVRVPLAALGSSETPNEPAQALCAGLTLPHGVMASVADVSDGGEAGPVTLIRLEAAGVGGHASRPQGTRNAIGMLVEALLHNEALASPKERTFLRLLAKIHESPDARALGIDATDPLFTPLTCIGGTIACEDGRLVQSVDVRYPPSTDHERIDQRLSEVAREHDAAFNLDQGLLMVPYQIDPEKPEVQALMDAYAQVSGTEPEPLTLGGGTYARHFANAVSFGPIEEGDAAPSWVGPMHGADEGFSVAALKRALKTYILALANLAKTSW